MSGPDRFWSFGVRRARLAGAALLALAVLLLSACDTRQPATAADSDSDSGDGTAAVAKAPAAPTMSLEQRVKAYWDARRDFDILTAYQMEAQALPGGKFNSKEYFQAMNGNARLLHYKIEKIESDGKRARVTLVVFNGVPLMGTVAEQRVGVEEVWSLIDGQWYRGVAPVPDGAET